MGISYDINNLKLKQTENSVQHFAHQRDIAEILKLTKNSQSIELLILNIKGTPEFIVYGSKSEAQMTNKFWNMHCFD